MRLVDKARTEIESQTFDVNNPDAMKFWVEKHGAHVAGWLLFKHRKQLHLSGSVDFKIPKKVSTPPWFRVAMEKLKHHPNWQVYHVSALASFDRTYRVKWLNWKKYGT